MGTPLNGEYCGQVKQESNIRGFAVHHDMTENPAKSVVASGLIVINSKLFKCIFACNVICDHV